MSDCMTFPDTVEEFMELYKITDTDHVYTNGIEMVPIFRMEQWFEHVSAQPKINNQINLCDSCTHTYPDCPAGEDDVLFGNGEGRDNICACRKYEVQGKQEIELDCDTCKHSEKQWDEPTCDGCCGHSAYEPKEQME